MKRLAGPVFTLILMLATSIAFERFLGGDRPWLNALRHILLGAGCAWFFGELWRVTGEHSLYCAPIFFRITAIVAGAVFLGVAWEIFEYQFNLVATRTDIGNPYEDTMKDLQLDAFGAFLVSLVFVHTLIPEEA